MGQKVNPHGFRVGIIKDWDSRWFVKDSQFGDTLVEDYKLRKMLFKRLASAGVPKIEIERDASKVRIHIHCAKPGIVIGKGGSEIEKLRLACEKFLNKPVTINIIEVKNPDLNAQLVAENIAQQLEKRISFRRAMKQCIGRAMRMGAKGIKTQVSGRLGGAEIARREQYHDGTIPLQTIRADIDYGFTEAKTTYGRIGVKVWIYRGEVLHDSHRPHEEEAAGAYRGRDSRRPRMDANGGGYQGRDGRRPRSGGGYQGRDNRGPYQGRDNRGPYQNRDNRGPRRTGGTGAYQGNRDNRGPRTEGGGR
jgi:small subunit ribosomal protein S3